MANKAKEKTTQLEQYYNQVLSKLQAELNCILFLELSLFVHCIYNCQVVFFHWKASSEFELGGRNCELPEVVLYDVVKRASI